MNASENPAAGAEIDGYRLLRPIGQGGFGTVWLCWSEASRGYHALKWVPGDAGGLQHELDALRKFREISQRLRSPSLIAIGHINLIRTGLIYTLPLADGMEGNDPSAESWRPMTLAERIDGQRVSPEWLSSSEILQIILPIIKATGMLNDEGLVHRDIKPANILFFGGQPCLADMGLLANDSESLTQRGTPGFLAPSWFLESSGQPDMWGLAATLYTLLTGNNPDKMGRPNFLWPPAGKGSLTSAEQTEWQRLHAVIYRVTHEKPAERFRDFQTFAAAVENAHVAGTDHRKKSEGADLPALWEGSENRGRRMKSPKRSAYFFVLGAIAITLLVSLLFFRWPSPPPESPMWDAIIKSQKRFSISKGAQVFSVPLGGDTVRFTIDPIRDKPAAYQLTPDPATPEIYTSPLSQKEGFLVLQQLGQQSNVAAPLRVLVRDFKVGDVEGWDFSNLPLDGARSGRFIHFLGVCAALQAFRDRDELLTTTSTNLHEGPPFCLRPSVHPDFLRFEKTVMSRIDSSEWDPAVNGIPANEDFSAKFFEVFRSRRDAPELPRMDNRFAVEQIEFRSVVQMLAALIAEKPYFDDASFIKLLESAPSSQRRPVFNAQEYRRADWEKSVEDTITIVLKRRLEVEPANKE